jgi:hypothetical protein
LIPLALVLAFLLAALPPSGVTPIARALPGTPDPPGVAAVAPPMPTVPVIARVYYPDQATLEQFAAELDILEAHRAEGCVVALLRPERYAQLLSAGYRVEIDQAKTDLVNRPAQRLPGQEAGIPGYPCYRTVEETYAAMAQLAADHHDLATWQEIGDSWDKVTPGGPAGYDLYVLLLTNHARPGPKPKFFLMAAIHAREYTTAESAARFAEYLISNASIDPDVAWLLDYFEIHIVPIVNPDGRKFAEQGYSWRKNTDNDDGCASFPSYGTDLNRNSSFKWGLPSGASPDPCNELYRGPSAASEPEIQAIQNYVASILPDQRGPGIGDPAPADAMGTFITLHSYGNLVLFPFGYSSFSNAPNEAALQTLGRKFGYFNHYTVEQSNQLYPASGTTDDWAYGELGIAAYTFEMGATFFESCTNFENTIWPANRPALLYAFKAARHPYMDPAGPDSIQATVAPTRTVTGTPVTLTAVADDTRYSSGEPSQAIAAARYSIDAPSWITGTAVYPMTAADGAFNSTVETVRATVDTTGLTPGRRTIFVESQDATGNWGVAGAVFLEIGATPQAALAADWNLVAAAVAPSDPTLPGVLDSLGGSYSLVQGYDACNSTDPWRQFDPAAPPEANDLTALDAARGYWLQATAPVTLTITGTLPITTAIALCPGWNLVGYPSYADAPLPVALASIVGKYDLVYGYDSCAERNQVSRRNLVSEVSECDSWQKFDPAAPAFANDLIALGPGRGYWIRMKEAGTLVVGP